MGVVYWEIDKKHKELFKFYRTSESVSYFVVNHNETYPTAWALPCMCASYPGMDSFSHHCKMTTKQQSLVTACLRVQPRGTLLREELFFLLLYYWLWGVCMLVFPYSTHSAIEAPYSSCCVRHGKVAAYHPSERGASASPVCTTKWPPPSVPV